MVLTQSTLLRTGPREGQTELWPSSQVPTPQDTWPGSPLQAISQGGHTQLPMDPTPHQVIVTLSWAGARTWVIPHLCFYMPPVFSVPPETGRTLAIPLLCLPAAYLLSVHVSQGKCGLRIARGQSATSHHRPLYNGPSP